MSYVPPHKRVSKKQDAPPPTPAQMIPQFNKSLNLKNSSRRGSDRKTDKSSTGTSYTKKIVYASNSISKWLAVPSMDDLQLPISLCLVPVCLEFVGQKTGEKPLILVNDDLRQGHRDIRSYDLEHMWAPVVETVHADLLSAFENLRNELVDQNLEETKPKIVVRLGKVLFRRDPSLNVDSVKGNSVSESYIRDFRRVFHTNLTVDYMKHIKDVVPQLGLQSEEEKELYHVKLADTKRPDSTISCKCRVQKDEDKLELYKIELNQVRNLVEDISCLESNVDIRLALCTKRILVSLQDEELQNIRDLISSAIFDPNVKGGLRWPLGKANSGGQFSVVGVWHTKAEAYSSSCIRLRMREADRFDFRTTTGEFSREIVLVLTGITKSLLEQKSEAGAAISIMAMLEDALKLIQNHFLAWDGSLVSCSE